MFNQHSSSPQHSPATAPSARQAAPAWRFTTKLGLFAMLACLLCLVLASGSAKAQKRRPLRNYLSESRLGAQQQPGGGARFARFNPFAEPHDDTGPGPVDVQIPEVVAPPAPNALDSVPLEIESWLLSGSPADFPICVDCELASDPDADWTWQLLPRNLIYSSYLAGMKESRFSSIWFHDDRLGWQWDSTLGGRVGLLRYGTGENFPYFSQGWQLDIEGSGMPRLDLEEGRRDLVSSDFRFGIPLTYGRGRYQAKFAYYHLSAHLGDEFLLRTMATRRNFVRDVLVWGHSYYLDENFRAYGEVGYAVHRDGGSEPWEFQFGFDWAPARPTGFAGAPFLAANAHLREEFDFGGNVVVQAGWAWRQRRGGPLARIGIHYLNGKSSQWELFDTFEEQLGIGLWYDF